MTLTLQLSCYNGARYLPFLFASLKSQTLTSWNLHVLDNASGETDKEAIKQAVAEAGFPIALHRADTNKGFAGAHNFLFDEHKHESTYVVLLNDDAILEPTYLETLVTFMESHPECGAAEGVVYRWNFDERESEHGGKTSVIDTRGLKVHATGAVSDIDAGTEAASTKPFKNPEQVFGVSGCLPCYRVEAIKMVSPDHTLFDPTFVIYKEDVELAFRLRAAGFIAYTVPSAIAYHRRSLGKGVKHTPDPQAAFRSYRNHLWMHFIHLTWRDLLLRFPLLLPYETLKKLYWLCHKPSFIFQVQKELFASCDELKRKRAFMRHVRKATKQRRGAPPACAETYDCDIAIIMVSHNDLSEECLRSIQAARARTSRSVQLVVADNDSNKYHANEFVQAIIPDAIVLLRDGDYGYGRSCNRAAREVHARHYFILNPDTVLTDPTLFDTLASTLEQNPSIGILAPKIFYFDGRLQETCRRFPIWFIPFITRTKWQHHGWGKRYMDSFAMRDFDHNTEKEIDWAQGSALYIDGSLWRLMDGFDDRFWLYFEDVDLCRRAHVLQRHVRYFPSVTLKHAHGKESATHANIFINLIKKKEARGHIISWIKYVLKWKGSRA